MSHGIYHDTMLQNAGAASERRSEIEEGGSRKQSSREVKGDRYQKEEVTLDHH